MSNMNGMRWQRSADDFAIRIGLGEVKGFLNNEVVVEAGTNAILLTDGACQGVTTPGRYVLSSLGDKLGALLTLRQAKQAEIIVIDTNDVELDYQIGGIFTNDPLKIIADLRLTMCVPAWAEGSGKPRVMDFFMNVMKGKPRYTLSDLKLHLLPEVENALSEFLSTRSATDLNSNLRTKAMLEEAVQAHLERTLGREGFVFNGVRAMQLYNEQLAALTHEKANLLVAAIEEESRVASQRRLADALQSKDAQDLIEETRRVEQFEKRSAVNGRMRRAVISDKMDEVKTEEDFRKFIDGIDREHLLRGDERAKLLEVYKANREDRERARTHLVARLDIEQRYELLLLETERKGTLTQVQRKQELDTIRQQAEFDGGLALLQAQNVINLRKLRDDEDRRIAQLAAADQRQQWIEDAKAKAEQSRFELESQLAATKNALDIARLRAEIRKLEIELERLEDDNDLLTAEKAQAMMRRNRAEKDRMELERMQRELDMEIARKRADWDMRMAEKKLDQAHEITRMETLGMLPVEAIMALTPLEQGRLIKELQETNAFKGMTEQQIMAAAAAKSPAVAQALTEKYKAGAAQGILSEELKILYERLISLQADGYKTTIQAQADALNKVKDQGETLGGMIRDVGMSKSGTNPTSPIIITSGQGGVVNPPLQQDGASAREVQICKNCSQKSPIGVKFCPHCGDPFFK